MSREDDLRQEITSINGWLSQSPSESFVEQLTRSQMERRLTSLQRKLSDTINRVLELRFDDPTKPGFGAISSVVTRK